MAFQVIGAEYESAFSSTAFQFGFNNSTRTDRVPLEEFPKEGMSLPMIQEEITKVGVLRQLYLVKKEKQSELKTQIAALQAQKKEFQEELKSIGDNFIKLRSFLNTAIRTFETDEKKDHIKIQENENMKFYEKENDILNHYNTYFFDYTYINEKQVKELDEQLAAVEDELSILYDFIITGVKDIIPEEKRQSNLCAVCIEKKVDKVLTPCGHTFCSDCTTKLTTCPLCRKSIVEKLTLYLTI
jgi:hypothetical protein